MRRKHSAPAPIRAPAPAPAPAFGPGSALPGLWPRNENNYSEHKNADKNIMNKHDNNNDNHDNKKCYKKQKQ